MGQLDNKAALVTGASTGIALAIGGRFAAEGAPSTSATVARRSWMPLSNRSVATPSASRATCRNSTTSTSSSLRSPSAAAVSTSSWPTSVSGTSARSSRSRGGVRAHHLHQPQGHGLHRSEGPPAIVGRRLGGPAVLRRGPARCPGPGHLCRYQGGDPLPRPHLGRRRRRPRHPGQRPRPRPRCHPRRR